MALKKVPLLDRLPAQVRHLILIFLGAFIGPLALQVQNGVNPLTWNITTFKEVLGAAITAAIGGVLLYVTPLTKQYGIGKSLTVSDVPVSPTVHTISVDVKAIEDGVVSALTQQALKSISPLFNISPTTGSPAVSIPVPETPVDPTATEAAPSGV
jgi:hypothetical protein